ncbi:MAG: M20/M25/M40 family metallo-hydrolase [Thermomicrobiales bacterium]|nr:M20/M25/M40 family metallo-hydrolase [Thermomicrobiales bacterium]
MATMDVEALGEEMLAFLAAREDEVVNLTSELVAAPSPNLPGDETAPAAVVQRALAAYDLPAPRVLAAEPNRPNLIVRIDAAHPGPHLALCGHLDTKPVGQAAAEWRTDPFLPTIEGDRLYGLGSTDMKGACAAMILAGAAFAAVADRAAGSLSLVFTADEEYGSRLGAEHLARTGAIDADAILLGEPAGVHRDWEAIRVVSRGFSGFRVIVTGTQTHSSISDQVESVNAVEAMARVIVGLRRELRLRSPEHPLCSTGPTVNIGVRAEGGVGYGVLPGHAEFWTDIRTIPGMTEEALAQDIDAALARIRPEVPGADVRWEFSPALAWIGPTEVAPEHPMVRAALAASERVLGETPPLAAFPGASDAWPLQGIGGIPTLAAWGPGLLPLAHGPNEYVSVRALEQAPPIFALTALHFGASA